MRLSFAGAFSFTRNAREKEWGSCAADVRDQRTLTAGGSTIRHSHRGGRQMSVASAFRFPGSALCANVVACSHEEAVDESAQLRRIVAVAAGRFFLNVFHHSSPHRRGKLRSSQDAINQSSRESRCFMIALQNCPSRASRQSQDSCFIIESMNSQVDQRTSAVRAPPSALRRGNPGAPLGWSSMPRRRECSASPCRRRCSPLPTK